MRRASGRGTMRAMRTCGVRTSWMWRRIRRSPSAVPSEVRCAGEADFRVAGDLTLRGVTRPVVLATHYLGRWQCPYWEGGKDLGPTARIDFVATTAINRHHFGVSWNAPLDRGGMVVGDEVAITLDVEAIAESDMQRIAGILRGQ